MKRIIIALAVTLTLIAVPVLACGPAKIAQLVGIGADRCESRNVSLTFEGDVLEDGSRTYVTISKEDGKRLYEALKIMYE